MVSAGSNTCAVGLDKHDQVHNNEDDDWSHCRIEESEDSSVCVHGEQKSCKCKDDEEVVLLHGRLSFYGEGFELVLLLYTNYHVDVNTPMSGSS